jgi:hypothetical protein
MAHLFIALEFAFLALSVTAHPSDARRPFFARIFNPYRPELHYMRGPGPACRAKRAALLDSMTVVSAAPSKLEVRGATASQPS